MSTPNSNDISTSPLLTGTKRKQPDPPEGGENMAVSTTSNDATNNVTDNITNKESPPPEKKRDVTVTSTDKNDNDPSTTSVKTTSATEPTSAESESKTNRDDTSKDENKDVEMKDINDSSELVTKEEKDGYSPNAKGEEKEAATSMSTDGDAVMTDVTQKTEGAARSAESIPSVKEQQQTVQQSNKRKKGENVNWESIRSRLSSSNLPTVLAAITELKEDFELLHSTEYPTTLATLLPAFGSVLKTLPCCPPDNPYTRGANTSISTDDKNIESKAITNTSNGDIYRIRNGIMEYCNNFPCNEILRPHASQLMSILIEVLRTDYEENALLATKLIVELHKNYRHLLIEYAEPYLDFVLMCYRSLGTNVQNNLTFQNVISSMNSETNTDNASDDGGQTAALTGTAVSTASSSANKYYYALKSSVSFRILTECPLTVILIFQLYPKFIRSHLMQLLPLMMEALGQRPPQPPTFPPSSVTLKQEDILQQTIIKQLFYKRARELLAAQVKTLTFVTFLLSRYGEQMKSYEDHLATNVLNLFQMCPREAMATRKDLLLALKHIFVTDFRKGFYKHIDLLLDDRVLIGKHKQSEHTNLRIEAYGALATLIPHICTKLSLIQISRIVHLYSRVLHDASMNLPLKSQMMGVNLLLQMVDAVFHNTDERASFGRDILYRIFQNLVWKIGHLAKHGIVNITALEISSNSSSRRKRCKTVSIDDNKVLSSKDDADEEYSNRLEQMYGGETLENQEDIGKVKALIRIILPGFKKLIWCISNYGAEREKIKRVKNESDRNLKDTALFSNNQHYSPWYEEMSVQSMSVIEQKLVENCLVWTLKAIQIFKDDSATNDSKPSEFHNAFDSLASALSVMDSFTFRRVIGPKINIIIDAVVKDADAIIMIQKFLLQRSNIPPDSNISPTFASCLINYLMQNTKELSPATQNSASMTSGKRKLEVILQLFELLFSSLAVSPKNELVLRPHLQSLVSTCLRYTINSDEIISPGINLEIIRKLFRAIAAGKFEESYKEISPLLSPLLNGLYRIFCQIENQFVRKIIIELCLTVPARLSSLLPHLPLLLRVITPALQTNDGDLINLGLRTLEFWVDNLNIDFLLPILSRDSELFSELMLSLNDHLRPAPYQYGLLTLRLLGKLGGKNRLFLQKPMDLPSNNEWSYRNKGLQVNCKWGDSSEYSFDLPLERAVFILQNISHITKHQSNLAEDKNTIVVENNHEERVTILSEKIKIEDINFSDYKTKLMEETSSNQTRSAFIVIRVAISTLLHSERNSRRRDQNASNNNENEEIPSQLFIEHSEKDRQETFLLASIGLFHAANIETLRDEAFILMENLMQHLVLLIASNIENIRRIDDTLEHETRTMQKEQTPDNELSDKRALLVGGKLQPLPAFGKFSFPEGIGNSVNCFMFNEAIPRMLKGSSSNGIDVLLKIIERFVEFGKHVDQELSKSENSSIDKTDDCNKAHLCCADVLFESLLYNLCEACFSYHWESRRGIYKGICKLLQLLGPKWSSQFEVVLVHVAFFCLKDYPNEIILAEKDSIVFFFRVASLLYGNGSTEQHFARMVDDICISQPLNENDITNKVKVPAPSRLPQTDVVCSMLIGELGCSSSIVRFGARTLLKYLYGGFPSDDPNSIQKKLADNESTTKRLLFSKSLRNLSVPEQIATVETFSFIVKHNPTLLPVSENLVLVFFSELLKMMSVADGEMTSESMANAVIINKDGYNPNTEARRNSCMISPHSSLSHASGIFLREEYEFIVDGIGCIVVPTDPPMGIQFRVSSLILFHSVLRAHSDTFFDADPSSSIGNILPHIVSLLFRSLTSRPEPAVDAAHAGLCDILNLSAKSKDNDSSHRLPKNLLQMCIRPVLLNLRDFTKLSIPLLRGLSRLLSLLSSWFSKTLGEKLLEHLQRWTDPEKIMGLGIWKKGEEPLVAAGIIDLFELLPDDSHFVELLVKTTLKLENVLPRYKHCILNESPFRLPLTKYLNKHEEATVTFFVNDHRLKNPIYSDLLHDILKRPQSAALRKKLSDNKWSTVVLNVCFERPLAIIRAEKGTSTSPSRSGNSPQNAADILTMHGINIDLTGQGQKCAALRQELENRKQKLQAATKDENKVKDRLQKLRKTESSATPEKAEKVKRSINNAQRQLEKAQLILSTVKKEFESTQKEYNAELAKTKEPERVDGSDTPRSMTFEALELQYQGFCLVETLMKNDTSYISEHSDVVRAFRWLWRSKGRHFRLFHEDSMSPRFNGESKVLARFLVNFAKTSQDVDILFDLLRIFLQPTSSDFSFVQHFLKDTVCNSLSVDQKRRVLQRFFPVISSEGIEELKVLSIQFLILPMLKKDFQSLLEEKARKQNNLNKSDVDTEKDSAPAYVLDKDLTSTFIKEVVLQGGKSRSFGSRLNIELLKLSSLLLEFMGNDVQDTQRQELIKFAWNLLRSDDAKTRQWACISICQYIVLFPTPPKNILQIYATLLRSHHQEAKELAYLAMSIIVPVLPKRLSSEFLPKVAQYTLKVLYEDGNSIPSLTHVWRIIVEHEVIFSGQREQLAPHLVFALNKIGLPMNSSAENRKLAITMIEMLLRWETYDSDITSDSRSKMSGIHDEIDAQLFTGLVSPDTSPMKLMQRLPNLSPQDSPDKKPRLSIRQNDLENVVNFLVRLILLITATDKVDQKELAQDATIILKIMLQKWPEVEVRGHYFDRVESMCIEYRKDLARNKEEKKNGSPENSHPAVRTVDGSQSITNPLLSACLDIFTNILKHAPRGRFLSYSREKCCNIIFVCFDRSRDEKQIALRDKLQQFLICLFKREGENLFIQEKCKTYLEQAILEVYLINNNKDQRNSDEHISHDSGRFFMHIIEEISLIRSNIPDLMSNSLVMVAYKLSKIVLSTGSNKRSNANSNTPFVTPFIAIADEVFTMKDSKKSVTHRRKIKDIDKKTSDDSVEIQCLICCLRLIGKSLVPSVFTRQRQKLMVILNEILEFSSDAKLLLAVTVLIGTWISSEKSMLTLIESLNFVAKLTVLEHRGLPEVESQPLFHAIALTILNTRNKYYTKIRDDTEKKSVLDQALTSCILVTNDRLRELSIDAFLSKTYNTISKNTNEFDYGLFVKKCENPKHERIIPNLRPIEILDKLICTSLDRVGGRLWTFIFVDILLTTSVIVGSSVYRANAEKKPENQSKESVFETISFQSEELKDLLRKTKEFLNTTRQKCNNPDPSHQTLLDAIRTLTCCDTVLCQELLQVLLKNAWSSCSTNKTRQGVICNLEKLLTQPSHVQFLKNYVMRSPSSLQTYQRYRDINSVQMMLKAMGKMTPTPMISLDAMLYLGKHYNCWHEVRRMMEMQMKELNKVPNAVSSGYYEKLKSSIRRCYLELGESDIWMTMKSESCGHPDIKWATSLDIYGEVTKAIHAYSALVDQMDANFDSHQLEQSTSSLAVNEIDLSFVEDRWISLHKELSQITVIQDFADDSDYAKLSMECAWKARDWQKLRSICSSPTIIASLESGDIEVKMSEIFLAIADCKLHEVENLHAQTAQLCLYNWQLLPPIYSGCCAHNELLHNFHRLVDIRESGQIMVETSNHSGGKTYPDLKNFLSAWRHRLPNDFDPLSRWDDIFQWRSHMYTAITANFQWAEQGTLASLHDRPWTAIKMANVARKQGVNEVALLSLAKLTDCAMDVSDAFSKLREQILSFRKGSELEKTGGLNLINTTNLEYFDSNQKGELIRLKAEFLDSLGARTKATQAYCHAVQLCPSYSKSWTSWGELCCVLADYVGRAQAAEKNLDKEKMNSNAKKIIQYLAQAMGCFLEAIQCDTSQRSRSHIPKCLQMLSKDGSSPGLLCSTFEKHAPSLPSWVWLTWIPQLLSSLCRIEARASKEILVGILSSYPQAIYFSLRSFYLERRDHDRSRPSDSNRSSTSGVNEAEELMSSLRKSHPTLWVSLESILEELIIRFRPSYEEELMTTITALLQRAESQIEQKVLGSGKESDESTVHASFTKTLSRVSTKFFRSQDDLSASNKTDERSRKSVFFTMKYKETFEKDFCLDGDGEKKTMSLLEIIAKLKKWKRVLESQVASSPLKSPLLQISPTLSAISNPSSDLWSGACVSTQSLKRSNREKDSEDTAVTLSTAESVVAATSAALAATRAVELANLYEGNGGQYGVSGASIEIPGQYSPNVADDSKPSPELNVKLVKFDNCIEVSRKNDQFVRRIGMVGSDGKTHQFLLQFAVPYWTRTDERTAQIHQLFGKCLTSKMLSSRRNLWMKPTAVIPIAQRLRMTADDRSNTSLYDVYLDYCYYHCIDPNSATQQFQEECKQHIDDSKSSEEKAKGKEVAYRLVCESVPSDILIFAMNQHFDTAEKYFFFQRTFTVQLAINSLLQYAFDVNERSPQKLEFNKRNGHVLSPDFRFSYSNQGFLGDPKAVPFRLTRNIVEFIGPHLMKGVFKPSLSSAASAISAYGQNIQPALHLLCRDDIISWYLSKSSQRDGPQRSTQDLERYLSDRVKKNVYMIQSRLRECAPRLDKDDKSKTALDYNVEKLITIASTPENIVSMPLTYCPWL